MANTNPFEDLDAHTDLMDQLKKTAKAADNVVDSASEVLTEISDHNLDLNAHPAIQERLAELEEKAEDSGSGIVAEHNASPLAHEDIRTTIKDLDNRIKNAEVIIGDGVDAHNQDENAHPHLQTRINELRTRLGDFNLTDLNATLTTLSTKVNEEIADQITALQTVDARHDNLINTNANNIASLVKSLGITNSHTTAIAGYVVAHQTAVDQLLVKTKALDLEEVLGYTQKIENAPDLLHFTSNLPTYVANNADLEFILSGATSDNSVQYTLTKGEGDYEFELPAVINNGTTVTLHVGPNNHAGDIIWFTVTATDTATDTSVQRVLALMISKPLASGLIDVSSLPTQVEPGKSYEFFISNLADAGDGRYTYEVKPLDSTLNFSKTEDITESETIQMSVPEDAVRGSVQPIQLLVHDAYGQDTVFDIDVSINELPDASLFRTTAPAVIVPGASYDVKFYGIKSAQGNDATYSFNCASQYITASKTTGILANEHIRVTVSPDTPRGETIAYTVNTLDENEVSLELIRGFAVNTLPDATDVATSLPASTQGGRTIDFIIGGGSDEESSVRNAVVSYDIDPGDSGFSFSKTTGIKPNETVSVSISKVAADVFKSFNIYAVDDNGERSAAPKQINLLVEAILILNAPTITTPRTGDVVDSEGFEMEWTDISWSVETDQRTVSDNT